MKTKRFCAFIVYALLVCVVSALSGTAHADDEENQTALVTIGFTVAARQTANVVIGFTKTTTTYTITYDLADGTAEGNPATYDVNSGSFTLNNPTRTGYTFAGWIGTGIETPTSEVKIEGLTGDLEFTATWTPIEYAITYDLNGGTATNPATYTIESDTFTLANPTKSGKTFKGWSGTGITGTTETVTIPKGSTGTREYSAVWTPAGGSFTPPDENAPAFAYFSLILSGQIGVNFYMYQPEIEGIDYNTGTQCWVDFDISGDKSNPPQVRDDGFTTKSDGRTYYGYRCYINALQMADKISAVFSYGDNSITKEYSAKDYLDAAMSTYTGVDYDILAAIMDYGHYAQIMLADTHGFTIGKDYAEMPGYSTYTADDYETVKAATDKYAFVNNNSDGSGIAGIEYSLNLDSSTKINLYLTVSDGYDGSQITAFLGDGQINVTPSGTNKYKIQVDNIPAHELGKTSTITINAAKTFTVEFCALSYVNTILKNYAEDKEGCDAVTAIYKYYEATMAYRAAHNYN